MSSNQRLWLRQAGSRVKGNKSPEYGHYGHYVTILSISDAGYKTTASNLRRSDFDKLWTAEESLNEVLAGNDWQFAQPVQPPCGSTGGTGNL